MKPRAESQEQTHREHHEKKLNFASEKIQISILVESGKEIRLFLFVN